MAKKKARFVPMILLSSVVVVVVVVLVFFPFSKVILLFLCYHALYCVVASRICLVDSV